MHTKLNTHQNDSNFLTHSLWSKTKLGMQHIHLELLWILSYAITNKNKHISRINNSDKHKIVMSDVNAAVKWCLTLMPRYSDSIGRRARGRERMRTDRRGDDGTVRPTSAGAPRGGEACPEGCGAQTGVAGPPRRPGKAVRRRHVPTAWVIPGSNV
jgi:hypothetical protein